MNKTKFRFNRFIFAAFILSAIFGGLPVKAATAHGIGSTIDLKGTVYFIDYSGTKRPYTSWGAFLSYAFNSSSKIEPGNSADEALTTGSFLPPQDGALINDKGTVYIITKGQRAGFSTEQAFTNLGYKFSNVIPGDTSFLSTLPVINNSNQAHPMDSLVLSGGTVYVQTSLGMIAVPSVEVFNSWGYAWKNIVPANAYDQVPATTPLVLPSRPLGYVSGYAYVRNGSAVVITPTNPAVVTNPNPTPVTDPITNTPVVVTPGTSTTLSAPTGLLVSSVSSTTVSLSWGTPSSSFGLAGYNIYRNSVKVGSTGHNVYTDTALTASTVYSYTVAAYESSGKASAFSGAVNATTTGTTQNPETPPVVPPVGNPAPIVPAPTNLVAHPRVWMNPARVAQLKVQVAANTIRWQRVKSTADSQVAQGSAGAAGAAQYLPDLCAAYLGTGDTKYSTRAGVVLAAVAVESNNVQYDSGYGYRFDLPVVIMGLDWCYDGLSVAQRQQAATWLMNRADWVWPESNPPRYQGWGVNNVANNYYWGFMMTGPAALAAAGDDTGSGSVSGTNRPGYHIALALNHWNNTAVPYLSGGAAGGAWPEGSGYDTSGRVSLFADAFQTAGTTLSTSYFTDAIKWRLQSTMPGGAYHIPWGAQARVSTGPTFIYDRQIMLQLLSVANANPTLAAAAQYWLNLVGQIPTSEFNQTSGLADELIRYNPSAPAASDFSSLTKDYYASGAGMFTYRQSWTDPNTTAFAFQSGLVLDSNYGSANNLRIWKGDFWVSGDANIYSQSGIEENAPNYNTLTIGGKDQVLFGSNGGSIVATQVGSNFVAARGQAKNAYGYPAGVSTGRDSVSDFLRSVTYLPQQDAFVVVDRVTAVNASQTKVIRWHSKDVPQISGNDFTIANPSGTARCFGKVVLPSNATLANQAYNLGLSNSLSSNAVAISVPPGNATDVIVTILQCTTGQALPNTASATSNATSVTATIGSTTILVPLNEGQAITVQ